jgi:hypothetical protein
MRTRSILRKQYWAWVKPTIKREKKAKTVYTMVPTYKEFLERKKAGRL